MRERGRERERREREREREKERKNYFFQGVVPEFSPDQQEGGGGV